MKAISEKIFEDYSTNEFLRENIIDFQFDVSNKTKEELVWKIVRNTTVLNRFIPLYVKELSNYEIIFLCNELRIGTEDQLVDRLRRNILKKWNSESPDILHHELIGKFSNREFLSDYLENYVFATTGKKEFLISIITENFELHEFVLKKLFNELETDRLSEICIFLEENKKNLFEFSSLTNPITMRKELSEQWNKTIFEMNEKNSDMEESGFIEKLKEIKTELDEAWQESGSAQTIDFEKLRKLKDELTENLKDNLEQKYKETIPKIEEKIFSSDSLAKATEIATFGKSEKYRVGSYQAFFELEEQIMKMQIQQANYQPVMVKTLLMNNGKCKKDVIVQALFDYNQKIEKELNYFRTVPVFDRLLEKGVVLKTKDLKKSILHNPFKTIPKGFEEKEDEFTLVNFHRIPSNMIGDLISLCDKKINDAKPYTTIPEPEIVFNFKDKNFFMINGPWKNWNHSLNNRIYEQEVLWATRGADASDIGIFNKLRIGDLVFFSNSTKDSGPFLRKMIFGFGLATKKFLGEEPYWPDELEEDAVIYKYRFSIKPIFVTYDEIEAIRWIVGLPFTKGFNSIANPETKSQLSDAIMAKWNITEKSLEKTQEELDEKFYKDKDFEKNESDILQEQTKNIEETAIYPDQLNSEFSPWEEKIFRKITENNILFEAKPWQYPLHEMSNDEIYVPDAELDGLCMCGRKVVVEAHENFTEEDAERYVAFVLEYYQSRYLILIVPDEQKEIWKHYQKQTKNIPYRELWSETEADEKIEEIYRISDRYAITQLPHYAICPKCQIEAKNQEQVFEVFGPRKMKNGRIITQSQCKQCR